MANYGKKDGVNTLSNGLRFRSLEKGASTFSPKEDTKCSYEYKGWYPKVGLNRLSIVCTFFSLNNLFAVH